METALDTLKGGEVPEPPVLPTFPELREIVGFPEYYEEEVKAARARTALGRTPAEKPTAPRPNGRRRLRLLLPVGKTGRNLTIVLWVTLTQVKYALDDADFASSKNDTYDTLDYM
jgi:hypothetical protein